MFISLLVGSVLVVITFLLHAAGLVALTRGLKRFVVEEGGTQNVGFQVIAMTILVLGVFGLLMVEISVWASAFHFAGFFEDFETAFYFSTSTFATVGFSEITPSHDWRMLAAIEGVAGFILIGWTTAFLVTAGIRVGPFRKGIHF